jgi:hypothetical protein
MKSYLAAKRAAASLPRSLAALVRASAKSGVTTNFPAPDVVNRQHTVTNPLSGMQQFRQSRV